MPPFPKNVRVGRNGRIGILKKIPQDLWNNPRYVGKAKVIERSTGVSDEKEGVRIAWAMLDELEREFAQARAGQTEDDRPRQLPSNSSRHQTSVIAESGITKDPPALGRGGRQPRTQIGEETRQHIIAVAMREFAEKGLKGARIDDIAANTRTTKPMIYYYFGSKEKLYAAVMEEAYGGMRSQEQGLHLDDLAPIEAMRRLVETTFDHHAAHPEYVRLISVENIEYAQHITGLPSMVQRNAIAIDTIRKSLERGEREGVFRKGVDPWHLHLLINSFCFMRVSNRYTWQAIFEMDLWERERAEHQRRMIVEAVLRYLQPVDNLL